MKKLCALFAVGLHVAACSSEGTGGAISTSEQGGGGGGGAAGPIDGVCGSANGANTLAEPTGAAACRAGKISGMTAPSTAGGDYTWTCTGSSGGSASGACSAAQTVNGACGAANGVATSSAPTVDLCAAGSVATPVSGSGPWTWGCNGVRGGSSTAADACSAPTVSVEACPPMPGNFTILHDGDELFGGSWHPHSNGTTYVAALPEGAGVALELPVDLVAYPYGFKSTDSTGGAKKYVVSRCPGSEVPVDGQDGTISVNGDAKLDNCKIVNSIVRWKDTSGATASYYGGASLSYETTCFLPTTTAQGSSTPATYYVNISNSGTGDVGVQYSNNPKGN